MRLWNGILKGIKTLLTLNEHFDLIEQEISELRGDINRIEKRIDDVYRLIVESVLNKR